MATTIYLTNTATTNWGTSIELLADVGVKGGGLTVSTTNSATTPVFCTDTAGGTQIEWWTDPLDAVTISGTITFNIWMAESNMSANVDAGVAIERRRAGDGVFLSTVVNSGIGTEAPVTTRAAQNWTASPTSTTLNAGDMLRFLVQCKDSIAQASGFTFTFGYAGTTGGADGDSFVTFTETITEQGGAPAANPPYRNPMVQLLAH